MGEVTFLGEPPYRLTPSRPTSARAKSGMVEMTVYTSVYLQLPNTLEIQTPISVHEARQLLVSLMAAISEAERQ
jgi:hypothetical protein